MASLSSVRAAAAQGADPTDEGTRVTVLERLAEFAVDTAPADVPAAAVAAARESMIDTLAAIFAGRAEPVTQIVDRFARLEGTGAASWVVTGGTLDGAKAALVNSAAAHALDFDDATTIALSGHISAVLVPTALAVGQQYRRSGLDALVAYAAGYEVEMAIARCLNPVLFDRGFHPTSVIGTFGAVATAARLAGVDQEVTTRAFAIAASMSAGVKANFGTMTKAFQVAWAAHSGIVAVQLAELGLTSSPSAFEGALGVAQAFAGIRTGADVALPANGTGWALVDPGIDLRKVWPVCGSVITSIEAGLKLRDAGCTDPGRIRSIAIGVHARRVPQVDRPAPKTGQDARYSAQYAVARTLVSGHPKADDFTDEAVADALVEQLLGRTYLGADPAQTARTDTLDGRDLGVRVVVETTDGAKLEAVVDDPLGSPRSRLPDGALEAKFLAAAAKALGSDRARDLYARLQSIDQEPDLEAIAQLDVAGDRRTATLAR